MDSEASRLVFEDVEEKLSGPLRRYLQRLVGNRATAEDLLQETLLKIARGLPGFEGRSSVKTWAFTIATRVATDHFRRPQSRVQMVEFDDTDLVLDPEIGEQLVIDEMSSCVRGLSTACPRTTEPPWCFMISRDKPRRRLPR